MSEKQKVKEISGARKNLISFVEETAYGASKFLAVSCFYLSMFDFILDGNMDVFSNYPGECTAILVAPVIMGGLIKKIDPSGETAREISEMVDQLKPKIRKRI